MNLIVIGIILLAIILIFISSKIPYSFLKILNIIIVISLSIVAYNLYPDKSFDIYRFFNHMNNTRIIGIKYLLNHTDYSSLPIASIYLYGISLFNNNHLLPFISCFIYYFFITNIIIDIAKNEKLSKIGASISLVLFYFISNFLGVISGIRNPVAISLFCYFFYKEVFYNFDSKKCIIIYILLCLFHPSLILLLILRLLLLLNNNKDKIIYILLLFWTFAKNLIINILNYFQTNSFINLILNKLMSYDLSEANAVANVNLYTMVYLSAYIILLITFIAYLKSNIIEIKIEEKKYIRFCKFLFCFCIGAIFEYHIFVRFSRVVLICCAFPIIKYFSSFENKKNKILFLILLFLEAILFLIFYFQGQYASIKFI